LLIPRGIESRSVIKIKFIMSQSINDILACPQIQEDLNTQFVQFDPLGAKDVQGFTDFVSSPMNTNGFLQNQIAGGNGKLRQVELVYTPPILESAVSDDATKLCVSTNEKGQISHTYEIDPEVGSSYNEKFTISNLAYMCKDNSLWFAQRLQAAMDALEKSIGTKNATQLALLNGAFGTGDNDVVANVKTISTKKTGGDFDIDALSEIIFSAMDAGYANKPFVFGYGEILKYFKKLYAGSIAAEGIDYGQFAAQNDVVFIADKKVKAALGLENFMMLQPGAVQMLTYNEFEGPFNTVDDGAYKQTVIVNPKNGRKFDFQLKNDCGNISVNLKLAHKLVGLPTDMYGVTDPYHNVTFVNEFKIVNP
jgi:hypothetical protein